MSLPEALLAPPIAHRGLWRAGEAAENTLVAFEQACSAGYGVELDVRLSSDHVPVVFHDERLERLADIPASVWDLTAEDLAAVQLKDGPGGVPTLKESLKLIAGRSMLLVEIKAGQDENGLLEARVAELLDHYRGPLAVISFDAAALAWFARHRPHLARGLDATHLSDADLAEHPEEPAAFMERRALAQPDFLVLQMQSAMGRVGRQVRAEGLPVIAWTVRSAEDAAKVAPSCDNFIFEGFSA